MELCTPIVLPGEIWSLASAGMNYKDYLIYPFSFQKWIEVSWEKIKILILAIRPNRMSPPTAFL